MTIRINRVYTRSGDKGQTALVGGKRVPKDSPRIEAYGTIDELNSIVGLARVFNEERVAESEAHRWLDDVLRRLQNELFDLGSELATPEDAVYEGMFRFSEREVTALEKLIDECQKDLEPLKSFTLPGGGRIGGFLHQCRTVCRRAERRILALSRAEPINPWTLKYVNRLSDLFFVLSRWVGKRLGEKEYLWERGLQPRRGASPTALTTSVVKRPREADSSPQASLRGQSPRSKADRLQPRPGKKQ
ncbi:MAG TPA: cob(I)yrinic acid a,c-diamide adenosyltransferase [Methylomirabilota bacterium]|nr:cob(I)yrinic acid a,c-diamide adenosyltransferase [Methylomirabilota bacterium]